MRKYPRRWHSTRGSRAAHSAVQSRERFGDADSEGDRAKRPPSLFCLYNGTNRPAILSATMQFFITDQHRCDTSVMTFSTEPRKLIAPVNSSIPTKWPEDQAYFEFRATFRPGNSVRLKTCARHCVQYDQ
jgi:hypothetical protein